MVAMAGGGMHGMGVISHYEPNWAEHAAAARLRTRRCSPRCTANTYADRNCEKEFDPNGRPQYPVEPGTELRSAGIEVKAGPELDFSIRPWSRRARPGARQL